MMAGLVNTKNGLRNSCSLKTNRWKKNEGAKKERTRKRNEETKKERTTIMPNTNWLICLFVMLALLIFCFVGVYIGSYSLDGIDHLNRLYEKKHRVEKVDRIIYVKAVFDQEYQDICEKEREYGLFFENNSVYFIRKETVEERISKTIKRASQSFEAQFGIKFILVSVEKWNPESRTSANLIKELREKISLDNCDIVIGFSGRATDIQSRSEMPQAGRLGNYILIGWYIPEAGRWVHYIFNSYHLQSYILTHELGHNFGAIHPEEIYSFPSFPAITQASDLKKLGPFLKEVGIYFKNTFSVMNAATGIFTTHFDKYNKKIILQNKYLPAK